MPARRLLLAVLCVALLLGLSAAAPISVVDDARAARSCGSIAFSGTRLRIVVLRGVSCRRAKQVARIYDRRFQAPRPWRCFLARQGDPEKIACGYGGRSGDVRRFPHAFVGR